MHFLSNFIYFLCNFTHFLYNYIFLCKSLFFCRWARQICVIVTDMSTLFGDDFLTFGIVEFGIVSTFVEVNRGKFEVVANVVLLEYLPQLCNVCAWFPAAMTLSLVFFKSSTSFTIFFDKINRGSQWHRWNKSAWPIDKKAKTCIKK